MNTQRLRAIRLWLFERDPHCWWCGREVILVAFRKGVGLPRNAATVDHLHFRGDPLRERHVGCDCPRHVLACYRCNTRRPNPYARERSDRARRQVVEQMQGCVR